MTDAFTDRVRLSTEAYATPDHLNVRRSIYAYRVPPLDLVEFAEDLVDWRGDELLLDVGCGLGHYVSGIRAKHPGVQAVVADLSAGMIVEAQRATGAPGLVGDVAALPFGDGIFDVTLAMHMLYHVPDLPRAAAELRRVTKPSGVALVSTNSREHLRELKALFAEGLSSVTGRPVTIPPHSDDRFNLENGAEILSNAFEHVRRKAAWGTLAIPGAAPVVDYIRSMRALRGDLVGDDDEAWEALVAYCERRVADVIRERGTFDLSARAGVFICR